MNWFKRLFKKKEVVPVIPVWKTEKEKRESTRRENKYRSSGSSYVGSHVAEDRRNDLLTDPLLSPLSPISPFSIWQNHTHDTNSNHQPTQDDTPSHSHDSHSHSHDYGSGHDYSSGSSSDSSAYDSGSSSSDYSSYDSGSSSYDY